MFGKSGPRRAAPQVNLLIKRRAQSYIISFFLAVNKTLQGLTDTETDTVADQQHRLRVVVVESSASGLIEVA